MFIIHILLTHFSMFSREGKAVPASYKTPTV